jgi:hypothetical protein
MKKVLILTAMLTLVTVWSCKNEFLEFDPAPDQLTDVSYFQNAKDFNSFTIGAYTELLIISNWMQQVGYISDDIRGGDTRRQELTGLMVPTNNFFREYWQSMYTIASRANILLEKLKGAPESISEADRAKIDAEAKFLRGFAYFNIARAWGNAPLLLETYTTAQDKIECTPEAQLWDQVILDLTAASQALPTRAQWGDANYGRATKGSALAFLANAYMYKENWAEAAKASEELIATNEHKLASTPRAAFTEALTPENMGESIFEVQFRDAAAVDWGNWPLNNGSLIGAVTAPGGAGADYAPQGGWGGMTLQQRVRNSMEPGDERRTLLVREGDTYKGERMPEPVILGTTFPITQPNVDFSTKFWLGDAGDITGSNIPLMRYAEFLLNYAEILFEQGKIPQAYAQLNAVRNRAKLPDLPESSDRETFMTALTNERLWELNMELNLYFHYTRTGKIRDLRAEQGLPYNPNYDKFPVPQSERDQNPNLCQNEGY